MGKSRPPKPSKSGPGKGTWSYNGNTGKWSWVGSGCLMTTLLLPFTVPFYLARHHWGNGQ